MKNLLLTALAIMPLWGTALAAPDGEPLSALESNTRSMGWMQGFPPPAEKTIRFTDPDFFAFPKLRWTVCHFQQLMPTVSVSRGTARPRPWLVELDSGLDSVMFQPLGSAEPMSWDQAFESNYTDGLLVLHHGQIVYERYDSCLDENTLHGAMSVTKSFTGLLGETLIAQNLLDEDARLVELIPELAGSAFADATVKQVLEMTSALKFSEDYADPKADLWRYAAAGNPLPKADGYEGPRSYFEFLQTVSKQGVHGQVFAYRTINADAMGWVIARVTGRTVAQWLSDTIWSQMGAEHDAFYTADSLGTPFAGGGLNATLRDLGRFAQLILNEGQYDGQQIIPAAAIERIRAGGDTAAFAESGYTYLDGWSYRGMWWLSHDDHGAFTARGVHGQTIWIDPKADMVIVRLASHPVGANAANDAISLPAYRAVADYLMTKDSASQSTEMH